MSFENNLVDNSPNGVTAQVVGTTPTAGQLFEYVPSGGTEGLYRAKFDGVDDYIQLGDLTFGGPMTACAVVSFNNFNTYSRIFDFGNGPSAQNFLMYNVGGTSMLGVSVFGASGGGNQYVRVDNVLNLVRGVPGEVCATVKGTRLALFLNGHLIGENTAAYELPTLKRTKNYIGESNWAQDSVSWKGKKK